MVYDPQFGVSDKPAGRAGGKQSLARAQIASDAKWVLDNPRGRRFLAALLRELNPLAASFTPGDPLTTAYNEGRRAAGSLIYARLTHHGQEHAQAIMADVLGLDVRDDGNGADDGDDDTASE